ncbi:J domain-containing protein [Clostridium uliginosum]|uniref:DnaJ domain-containing protein n=1 Tax=Clostridium uliginosum TaxID=119641 RepID=A0A1I1RY19_9CLOT|nr:J domain-containing protein [Clostridium uliginosum]SFD37148.1 DnaJ domain-containing protein [Clostridium uliginosum]
MNPYEVLGLNPNATQEEIKIAYRKLTKQYHPDQYGNNPLKELAEQKMREINAAYTELTKGSHNNHSSQSNSNTYSNSSYIYQEIRQLIQSGKTSLAESKLNAISNRDAEWHYLYGVVCLNKNWFDAALEHINTAVNMDPNNFEYRQGLNSLKQRSSGFSNNYYRTTNRNSNDACDCCIQLWCLDSLCECMGGDLIGCC